MIWRYHYFWKHPYLCQYISLFTHFHSPIETNLEVIKLSGKHITYNNHVIKKGNHLGISRQCFFTWHIVVTMPRCHLTIPSSELSWVIERMASRSIALVLEAMVGWLQGWSISRCTYVYIYYVKTTQNKNAPPFFLAINKHNLEITILGEPKKNSQTPNKNRQFLESVSLTKNQRFGHSLPILTWHLWWSC